MRERLSSDPRVVLAALVGGAIATVVAAKAAAIAWAGSVRSVTLAVASLKFGGRVATLDVWRRCPDCYSRIDSRARVCPRCSFRMRRAPAARR